MMTGFGLFVVVFTASAVEAVEALTIVLAMGMTRDWRSALSGAGAALLLLAVLVAVLGPGLTRLPVAGLRLVIGGLLVVFGLQWLRKAILRASGLRARHDEEAAYAAVVSAAARAPQRTGRVTDGYAFTLAFKAVLLEGVEVAFIALTVGASQRNVPIAALAAIAAVVVVALVGVAVRAPLSRVPENGMKFAVGVLLTSFGIFWGAEGAGARWPGDEAALLALVPATALFALALVGWLRPAPAGSPKPRVTS